MPALDLPLAELERYAPALGCPEDFDAFWEATKAEARARPLEPRFGPEPFPGGWLEAQALTFSGFAGQEVAGWLLRPRFAEGPLPVVVVFHGYSGGRNLPLVYAPWLLLGCAVLTMDTRGQGGATGNALGYANPAVAGWMTQGLLAPRGYYYRAVFADAIRLLDVAFSHDGLDPERVAVTGISQGGGITVAAAALEPRVALAMPDVPFLTHYRRGAALALRGPYLELVDFFRRFPEREEAALATLGYFDGVHFAARIEAESLWSVALHDDICPPSTVYAAYNACKGPKAIRVYPYNNHEGGGPLQQRAQLERVAARFGL